MKKLYLMCGPSGCGKSTYTKVYAEEGDVVVSRDAIRFSLLEETDDYFAKEGIVFAQFVREVAKALVMGETKNVWADATHLTEKSRRKFFDNLSYYLNVEYGQFPEFEVIAINLETTLSTCKARNAQRLGRARVPEYVIERQFNTFVPASREERYIDKTLTIEEAE